MNKPDLLSDYILKMPGSNFPDDGLKYLLEDYNAKKKEFKSLVNSKPKEQEIQSFLEKNPIVLLHAMLDGFYPVASGRSALFPKIKLGSEYETDFAYCSGNSMGAYWTFVELERPDVPLFNRKGDPSQYLSHAMRQLMEWKAWIEDHKEYAIDRLMSLIDNSSLNWHWPRIIRKSTRCLVVIGRRGMLTKKTNRLRIQICNENPFIEIITYDRLFDDYAVDKDEPLNAAKDEVRLIRKLNR